MMRQLCFSRLVVALLLPLALVSPARAQEAVEEATASTMPWSGWWWPARTGQQVLGYRGEAGPLVKLDAVTGKRAAPPGLKW